MSYQYKLSFLVIFSTFLVNFSTQSSLTNQLKLFDSDVIKSIVSDKIVSDKCLDDLTIFVNGVDNGKKWALKLEDSSGRYSSGLFFGNNFFLGSKSQCDTLHTNFEKNIHNVVKQRTRRNNQFVVNFNNYESYKRNLDKESIINNVRYKRDARLSHSTTTLSPSGWTKDEMMEKEEEQIPFSVVFSSVKLQLHNITNRPITLGLCLPTSCTQHDITILMTSSSTVHKIISIKTTQEFNFLDKPIGKIMLTVSIIVTLLLIIGSCYDYWLEEGMKKLPDAVLDIHTRTSKSTIYVVNNNNNNNETSSEENTSRLDIHTILKDILLSFSLQRNTKQIFDKSVSEDTVPFIHGLRTVSMCWVILGHTCLVAFKYADNQMLRSYVEKELGFQIIVNGVYSVDTFFFISGLLVSYLYFRTSSKGRLDILGHKGFKSGLLHFLGLLGYRFCRLSAPYLFTLGLVQLVMSYLETTTPFDPPANDAQTCQFYWYRNILYINTFFPISEMCMLWSWYLSNDSQFFLLACVGLVLAKSRPKLVLFLTIKLVIVSFITTFTIALQNNYNNKDPLLLFDQIYDKPWTRFSPYCIGLLTGYYLYKKNCKPKVTLTNVVIFWLLTVLIMLSLLFGLYNTTITGVVAALHATFSHFLWSICISWIIIFCCTYPRNIISKMLSHPLLYSTSRVTYCTYLIHPLILRYIAMTLNSPIHLQPSFVFVLFLGQSLLSFVAAFVISVTIEAPCVCMLKILRHFNVKKKKNVINNNNSVNNTTVMS